MAKSKPDTGRRLLLSPLLGTVGWQQQTHV